MSEELETLRIVSVISAISEFFCPSGIVTIVTDAYVFWLLIITEVSAGEGCSTIGLDV